MLTANKSSIKNKIIQDVKSKQPAVRNRSVIGIGVYSDTGEFSTAICDAFITGRGISFKLIRTYRSGNRKLQTGIGKGWSCNIEKKIFFKAETLFYADGFGMVHQLKTIQNRKLYEFPAGIYSTLTVSGNEWIINQRFGRKQIFEAPEAGGRLILQRDRNGNEILFKYSKDKILISDTLNRTMQLSFVKGLLGEFRDHGGRKWKYVYDDNGCLIDVIKPSHKKSGINFSSRYIYDKDLFLIKTIDAKGQTWLQNIFRSGRVVEQLHGNGTFKFKYNTIENTNGAPDRITTVLLKDATKVQLTHDDNGHVIKKSIWINKEAFPKESSESAQPDFVEIVTKSAYNYNGELVERVYPGGRKTVWQYDEKNIDPLAKGNLVKMMKTSSKPADAKIESITTSFTYQAGHQLPVSKTDGKGNIFNYRYDSNGNLIQEIYPLIHGKNKKGVRLSEKFEYNISGQLIHHIDSRGAATVYYYYSLTDPYGSRGQKDIHTSGGKRGGFLARIVKDPNVKSRTLKGQAASLITTYAYDNFGNLSVIWDGKSNPTKITYDLQNRIVAITPRSPFTKNILIKRDENGYPIKIIYSLDHQVLDAKGHSVRQKSSLVHESFERNNLNNVTRHTISADNEQISTAYTRDENENVVEVKNPIGIVGKYRYTGGDLLIGAQLAVDTKEQIDYSLNYTRDLSLGAIIDKSAGITEFTYDGFARYQGQTNLFGIKTVQLYDENNNIEKITISQSGVSNMDKENTDAHSQDELMQMNFSYDPCDRCTSVDYLWNHASPKSATNLSSLLEYDAGFLPNKIISVSGKEFEIGYNGTDQITLVRDRSGDFVTMEYDKNGSPVEALRQNKKSKYSQMTSQQVDGLDRIKSRSLNGSLVESLDLNFTGLVKKYQGPSGIEYNLFHNGFGQLTGIATTGMTKTIASKGKQNKLFVTQFKRDKTGNLLSITDPAGKVTQFVNDAFGRVIEIIYPDGTVSNITRDSKGIKEQTVDANKNVIVERIILKEWLDQKIVEIINTPYHPDSKSSGIDKVIDELSGRHKKERLDTVSSPVDLPGYNSSFDDNQINIQDLINKHFGFNPGRDLNLPGNESSRGDDSSAKGPHEWSVGEASALILVVAAGAICGGPLGAVGALVAGFGGKELKDAMDKKVEKNLDPEGGYIQKIYLTPIKKLPTDDTNLSQYKPKFTPKSLIGSIDKLIHFPGELVDPVWEEKDEPLGVLRQFGQATDPDPTKDEPDTGGEIRTILGTNQAVTDGVPDNFIIVANVVGQLVGS